MKQPNHHKCVNLVSDERFRFVSLMYYCLHRAGAFAPAPF